ncbi:caspase family protein [Streptomyces sp. 4.24]|uniref:caspase family protein n=1 Tax=Streptomyces tritrimontium TaxID=3406573 RepID=UPI003BB5A7A2
MFTADELPNLRVLLGIVRHLSALCWRADEEVECDRFDGLWQAVLREAVPEPGLLVGPLPRPAHPVDAEEGEDGEGARSDPDAGPDDGPDGGSDGGPDDAPARSTGKVSVHRQASRALIIGAESYADLPPLPGTAQAVHRLADVLSDSDRGYFAPEHTDTLVDPTAAAVLRALMDAAGSTDGTLLVHLACHGITDRHGDLHLLFSDAGPGDGGRPTGLVPYSEIQYVLSQARASNLIVFIDACYVGRALEWPVGGRLADTGELAVRHRPQVNGARATPDRSVHVIGSTTDLARPHAFTSAVIEALSGAPEQPSAGVLSLDDLYRNVRESLAGAAVTWRQVEAEGGPTATGPGKVVN